MKRFHIDNKEESIAIAVANGAISVYVLTVAVAVAVGLALLIYASYHGIKTPTLPVGKDCLTTESMSNIPSHVAMRYVL